MLDYFINILSDKHFIYIFISYLFTIISFVIVFIIIKIKHKNTVITITNKVYKN